MCSDQEAVDLIRNVKDPQAASKVLVDHALARFSTDNLSVMIIRFDSKILQSNAASNIGVETDPAAKAKGAVTEVELIVDEAKRQSSIINNEAVLSSDGSDDVKYDIIKEMNEDQEAGPELTEEGLEKARGSLSQESKETTTDEAKEG